MKSYLRHSKDRRVRGSANGASTVSSLLGTKKKKKISPQTGIFKNYNKNYIERGGKKKKKFSLALPPEQKLQDLVLFSLMEHGRNRSTRINCSCWDQHHF